MDPRSGWGSFLDGWRQLHQSGQDAHGVRCKVTIPALADRRVGHREWGLRPQTPPLTEVGGVAL